MNADPISQSQILPSSDPMAGTSSANNESKSSRAFIHVISIPVVLVPLPHIARMHIPNTDIPEKMFSQSKRSMKLRRRCIDDEQVRLLTLAKLSQVPSTALKRRKTHHSLESDMLDSDLDLDFELDINFDDSVEF